MRKLLLLVTSILLLSACSQKREYWPLSKFRMVPDALMDGDSVKVIYYGPRSTEMIETDYYSHIMVIAQKSGDTINVLTRMNNDDIKQEQPDDVFTFVAHEDIVAKTLLSNNGETQKGSLEEIEKMEIKKPEKVSRNPEHDFLTDNNFPTVIGLIGKPSSLPN